MTEKSSRTPAKAPEPEAAPEASGATTAVVEQKGRAKLRAMQDVRHSKGGRPERVVRAGDEVYEDDELVRLHPFAFRVAEGPAAAKARGGRLVAKQDVRHTGRDGAERHVRIGEEVDAGDELVELHPYAFLAGEL
jgi:hypothetical protein